MKKYFLLWLAAAFTFASPPGLLYASDNMDILYTGDMAALVFPSRVCGATISEGGMGRQTTLLNSFRSSRENLLLFDVGGFVARSGSDPVIRSETMAIFLKKMNYSAINLSWEDFRLGYPFLKTILDNNDLPFVSSNLFDKSTGQPIVQPHITLENQGSPILVFGLLDPQKMKELTYVLGIPELTVQAPVEALEKMMADTKNTKATQVLLSQCDAKTNLSIAEKYPELIILAGHKGRSDKRVFSVELGTKSIGHATVLKGGRVLNETILLESDIPQDPEAVAEVDQMYFRIAKKGKEEAIKQFEKEMKEEHLRMKEKSPLDFIQDHSPQPE